MNKRQQQIIEFFHETCNALAGEVNRQLFDNSRNIYWVGEVIGGTCYFDDIDFLSPEDMVLIIEHGLTYDEYAEWRDANINSDKYINLRSWLKGCRHDMLKQEDGKNKNLHR